jgi:rare lipoprotein A
MRLRWTANVASSEMSEVSVGTVLNGSSRNLPAVIGRLARCALLLGLAGCAGQSPQRFASREYFPESIYGRASPRVVAFGQPVPRGGGQYLVGRPYTVAGRTYYPSERPRGTEYGVASYYGSAFHGRRTANGEIYDMASISAAHPTMPLPSYARVTNLANHRSIIVRVNDRGPYATGRVMDVSDRAAEMLDFKRSGTASVRVDYIGPAGLDGSDDAMLVASLRTDGRPAELDGQPAAPPTMLAETTAPGAPMRAPLQQLARAEPAAAEMPLRATSQMPLHAPLPPARPFDLGTIPGAGVPLAAGRQHQAEAVLYRGPVPGLVRIGAGDALSQATLTR